MKAVITAAGLGTRSGLDGKLRKEMLPVYDMREGSLVLRPMIDCIITRLSNAGISDFAVVLDPDDSYTKGYLEREFPDVAFVYQHEKRGFGDAVLRARSFVGDDSFILNAGDGMVLSQYHLNSVVKSAMDYRDRNILTLFRVPNPSRYGTARVRADGDETVVTEVVEKSPSPPSNLALAAFYHFAGGIMDYISGSGKNVELTPAINRMIKTGTRTVGMEISRPYWASVGIAREYVEVLGRTLKILDQES